MEKIIKLLVFFILFQVLLYFFNIKGPLFYMDKTFEVQMSKKQIIKFKYNSFNKLLNWSYINSVQKEKSTYLLSHYLLLLDEKKLIQKLFPNLDIKKQDSFFYEIKTTKKLNVISLNNKASKQGDYLDNLLVMFDYCLKLNIKNIVWVSNARPFQGEIDSNKFLNFSLKCAEIGIKIHTIEKSSQSNSILLKKISELSKGRFLPFGKDTRSFLNFSYSFNNTVNILLCDAMQTSCKKINKLKTNRLDLNKYNIENKNIYNLLKIETLNEIRIFKLYE